MVKKIVKATAAFLLMILLTACGTSQHPTESTLEDGCSPEPTWNTIWLVYWDVEAVNEEAQRQVPPKANIAFACHYDDSGTLYMPDSLAELCEAVRGLPGEHYLSVTNDVHHVDGTATQKDPKLAALLFDNGMEHAAQALLDKVRELDFDGLEIDFENIKDLSLWQRYTEFLSLLWQKASDASILFRVVLPCSAPVDSITLPDGPAYTVMCYNLFGTHSGPGPKADSAFLRDTAEKFRGVPNLSYALAAGGFIWDREGRTVCSVTEQKAVTICREYGARVTRDPDSAALTATYREGGETYTIVYADGITLATWQSVLRSEAGEHASFDLWRAGGNLPVSAEEMK